MEGGALVRAREKEAALIARVAEMEALVARCADLERALWIACRNTEIVVRDDTPRSIEWKTTDDGGRLVRRAR